MWPLKTKPCIGLFVIVLTFLLRAVAVAAPLVDVEPSGRHYAPFPAPDSGYVTDLADLLSSNEEERIERLLWQTESQTKVEIAVVTINSMADYPGVHAKSIEEFARQLFDTYGIGNKPANNGVLLLVAARDRKVRIELGAGYGHARDTDANAIVSRNILPAFRSGDYARGISAGVDAIMREFAGAFILNPVHIGITVACVIALVLIIVSLFRNGKRGWGWIAVGILIVLLLVVLRIVVTILENMPRGHSSGWSAGGSGGGFGGGFSGGGGATGSW